MNRPTICVHTLVKNEENFLWYAVSSVADHVDKIFLWDTGSDDRTVQLIKELIRKWRDKIDFREKGQVNSSTLVKMRQEMLDETESDWIMILDGDEVWWEDGIKKVLAEVDRLGPDVAGVAAPFYNCVGDIFHYQEETAGRYSLAGRRGHLNLRFVKNIKDLEVLGTYPHEFYTTDGKQPIQDAKRIDFVDTPYLHLSHLVRSSKDVKRKEKAELGIPFPLDFYYPESFFKSRPTIVPSPWLKITSRYQLIASLETPFKKIRRKLIPNG